MAMKPVQAASPVPTTEPTGSSGQNETKIDCVFTHNGNSSQQNTSFESLSQEYKNLQEKILNGEMLSEQEQQRYDTLKAIADMLDGDLANINLTLEGDGSYCSEFLNQNIAQIATAYISGNTLINKLKGDLSDLTPEEQQAKIAEIMQTASNPDEAFLLTANLAQLCKDGVIDKSTVLSAFASLSTEVSIDDETNNLNEEIDTDITKPKGLATTTERTISFNKKIWEDLNSYRKQESDYYKNIIDFITSDKLKDIDTKDINSKKDLKTSKNSTYIEYQYLLSKLENGEQLTDFEQTKYNTYKTIADKNNGDLTNINIPISDIEGSYCEEFKKSAKYAKIAIKEGKQKDQYLKELVKAKLVQDLKDLSPEEQHKKIIEILNKAGEDGALLLELLYTLENEKIIDAETLNNAFNEKGITIPTKSTFSDEYGSKNSKTIIAEEVGKELEKGNNPFNDVQFKAYWDRNDDKIKGLITDICGSDRINEILVAAEREIAASQNNIQENNTKASTNNTHSNTPTENGYTDLYNEQVMAQNGGNIFMNASASVDNYGHKRVHNPENESVLTRKFLSEFLNRNINQNDITTPVSDQIVDLIKESNDPIRRAELFTQLSDEAAISLVMENPKKYMFDIRQDNRLFGLAMARLEFESAGDVGKQRDLEEINKDLKQRA